MHWSGAIRLDSIYTVPASDTLRIHGGTSIVLAPNAGMSVHGVLLMSNDSGMTSQWDGGQGIQVERGGVALFLGARLKNMSQGILLQEGAQVLMYETQLVVNHSVGVHLRGGQLSALKINFSGVGNHVWAEAGVLQFDDCSFAGSSFVLRLQGTSNTTLEDSKIEGDTLWWVGAHANLALQDSKWGQGHRYGKAKQTHSSLSAPKIPEPPLEQLSYSFELDYGRRVSNGQSSLDAIAAPAQIIFRPNRAFRFGVSTGILAGYQNQKNEIQGRDRTQFSAQWVSPVGISLEALGGMGGSSIEWTASRYQVATQTLDRSLDISNPLASPGAFAGGLLGYQGEFLLGTKLDAATGFQWRGENADTELGDLFISYLRITRKAQGFSTLGQTQFVYALGDKYGAEKGSAHWQWVAQLDQRRQSPLYLWGYRLTAEARDHTFFAGDSRLDISWSKGSFQMGPQVGVLFAMEEDHVGGAGGAGALIRRSLGSHWKIDLEGWVREHRDLKGINWFGGDLSLKVSGGI
jgi:hypothetical protein